MTTNPLLRVVARIDWPQFILTTFVGAIIGYMISKTFNKAEKGEL